MSVFVWLWFGGGGGGRGKYGSFSLLYFYLGGEGVNAMTVLSYI